MFMTHKKINFYLNPLNEKHYFNACYKNFYKRVLQRQTFAIMFNSDLYKHIKYSFSFIYMRGIKYSALKK